MSERRLEIFARLRELDLSGEVWALFSELHELQNMHPDIVAAKLRREKDRARKFRGNSTEKERTKEKVINIIPPEGGRGVGKGETIHGISLETEFAQIWQRYPCKKSKGRALKAYRAKRKVASFGEISAGVDRLIAERREPKYWPYFATWLNDEGWLDEGNKVLTFRPAPAPTRTWAEQQAEKAGLQLPQPPIGTAHNA